MRKAKKTVTIYRQGVPIEVAPWYGKLSPAGRAMVCSVNIMAPYSAQFKATALPRVEYTVQHVKDASGKELNLPCSEEVRIRAAHRRQAIAAFPLTKAGREANAAAMLVAAE